MNRTLTAVATMLLLSPLAQTAESPPPALAEIINFRQYSATFASAGQPGPAQFAALADAGYQRVVYLAFTDNPKAVPNADQMVKALGMEYMHVPVDFDQPLAADFYAFADSMQRNPDKKTLLHCQVNFRASAFSFLYRVIHDQVPVAAAKADMNTVWQPNQVWRDFIFAMLAQHGIDPACEGCDWTVAGG